MRTWRLLLVVASAAAAAACSVTEPVIGLVGRDGERYDGTATGYLDRTGTITMASQSGARCTGSFHYTGAKSGVGSLTCSDGARASIQFQSITNLSGFGYGVTDRGEPIQFTYGLSEEQSKLHLTARPPARPAMGAQANASTPPAVAHGAKQVQRISGGTGFVVAREGKVLTNSHVVEACERIAVRRMGADDAAAKVAARDARNDLALLIVDNLSVAPAKFRAGKPIRAGEEIVVYGFPYTGALASSGNVTIGNVSALSGLDDDSRQLQISAPIQAGNSGGPLLDAAGSVVGIIRSKLNALKVAGVTGDLPQNVNFAIKSGVAQSFLDANGVAYEVAPAGRAMSVADIGDAARQFTVAIQCFE